MEGFRNSLVGVVGVPRFLFIVSLLVPLVELLFLIWALLFGPR